MPHHVASLHLLVSNHASTCVGFTYLCIVLIAPGTEPSFTHTHYHPYRQTKKQNKKIKECVGRSACITYTHQHYPGIEYGSYFIHILTLKKRSSYAHGFIQSPVSAWPLSGSNFFSQHRGTRFGNLEMRKNHSTRMEGIHRQNCCCRYRPCISHPRVSRMPAVCAHERASRPCHCEQ